MSGSEVKRCMDWLFQKQGEMETAPFGYSKFGVLEALAIQQSKAKDILSFKDDIDKAVKSGKLDDKSTKALNGSYDSVKALSEKRNSCLEVISQIASLEDLVQNLSNDIDARSVHLVKTSDVSMQKGGLSQSNESLARTAQTCIMSVRQNWKWVFQVMQCAEVHLRNAAAYQEFFQEVEEAEYWMNTTLSRIHLSFDKSKLLGNRSDAESILQEIKDVLAAYLQWQTKIDYLFDKAKQVVPVPQRLKGIPDPKPVISLTDFKTSEIDFIEGETLTLLDNSDQKKWKVKTETGQVGMVPAVIILIPAPSGDAIDAAIRLRLQLLSLWTSSVKRLGYQMIAFMLLVFRDWTEDEVNLLQAMAATDKEELLRILHFIEETLITNWSDYDDFQELQERITRLKMILEEAPESDRLQGDKSGSNKLSDTVVVQVKTLENLLNKYKDFWTFWETFKCVAEMLKQPKFMLVCDKWDQLRFVTSAHFVKFWDTQLDLESDNLARQDLDAKNLARLDLRSNNLVRQGQDSNNVGQLNWGSNNVGHMGQNLNNIGQLGQDSSKVGQMGQDSSNMGQMDRDSSKIGQLGQSSNNMGQFDRDSSNTGQLGRDSSKMGQLGQVSSNMGQLGRDSSNAGQLGRDSSNVRQLGQGSNTVGQLGHVSDNRGQIGQDSNNVGQMGQGTNKGQPGQGSNVGQLGQGSNMGQLGQGSNNVGQLGQGSSNLGQVGRELRSVGPLGLNSYNMAQLGVDSNNVSQLNLQSVNFASAQSSMVVYETPREKLITSEVTIEEQKEETTTDTVTSTLEEERHTFIITGVIDPRDDRTQLPLQQAITLGVVDKDHKNYTNPKTGQSMTMVDAMNEGRVLMEFVSKRKIREEKNSYGLITIKITKESKPYTIIGVIDPVTEEKLTIVQATDKDILDENSTTYRTEKGELIPIADAIHSGLVLVEYHEGEVTQKAEVVSKTYAVHGVVDQRRKQKVSFSDAVRDGLLARDTGEYINNVTRARVGVHEAIMKGFIKARIVTDPSKLEISPENKIVIEKLANAKSKLLKSVKAIKAFQSLGK